MPTDSKVWYTSKTLWAQAVLVVATVASALGLHVMDPVTQDTIVGLLVAAGTIYFRLTSGGEKLTLKTEPPPSSEPPA